MSDHDHIVATNAYSPFLSRSKVELEEVNIHAALFNEHNHPPSPFREPPSEEVDAAWHGVHKGSRLFLITPEELKALGKDPEVAVKAPVDWGMGSDLYLAVNQGQHDLHCLNNIRKFAYRDYYYKGNDTAMREVHFLHCLMAVLQSLQCKFSTDVYTVNFVEYFPPPATDMNITRKCQKWDNIYNWEVEKAYTDEQFASLTPGPNAKRLKHSEF